MQIGNKTHLNIVLFIDAFHSFPAIPFLFILGLVLLCKTLKTMFKHPLKNVHATPKIYS